MNSKEVLQFKNVPAIAMSTVALAAGGLMTKAEAAFGAGVNRAPITCPDPYYAQDPSADPCSNQEDGTVITITDYNNYPNTDPGTKNTHYAYPNGDSQDKLQVPYGVRDTYTHSNGSAADTQTCNVLAAPPAESTSCATWDAQHHDLGVDPGGGALIENTTGGDGDNGGGTTPTPDPINEALKKRAIACANEDVDLRNNPYNFSTAIRRGGAVTTRAYFQNLRMSEPACNDINTDRNVTIQYYQKRADGKYYPLTRRQNVINPTNDNNRYRTRKTQAVRRVLCGSRYPVYGLFRGNSSALVDVTNDGVNNPTRFKNTTSAPVRTKNFRVC